MNSVNHAIYEVICLSVGFERKKTWLLNSFVILIPLFAYRVIFSFRMMRTF